MSIDFLSNRITQNSITMYQNYFKTALRHLKAHKAHVAINVIGLSLGLAGCIISYLLWQYDAEFDQFHTKAAQIYRVNTVKTLNQETYGVAPAPLAALAKTNITGVEDAIAMDFSWEAVSVGRQSFNEDILFTEGNFLDWFDFKLAQGTANLIDPGAILLTERMAKKYFGTDNPIGETITLYGETDWQKDLIVTGVIKDFPKNSSIHFNFITNFKNKVSPNGNVLAIEDWKQWREGIFLAVNESESIEQITTEVNQYVAAHQAARPDFNTLKFNLDPLTTMAQHSSTLRWNNFRYDMPAASIWSNVISCLLLLFAACLNFANMTVSLSGKRLKEIGVRKVMGGSQRQLIGQLLTESFLVCLLSLVLALGITDIWSDWINRMWAELDLNLVLLNNPAIWAFLTITIIVTTLAAGAYPAFYISSFNPNKIFHGAVKFGGSNWVSKILLSVQVTIALIAVVVSLTFYRNAVFQQTTDLGFNRDAIQAVWTGDEQTFTVFNNQIKQNPLVTQTAGVRYHIGDSCPRYDFDLNGEKHEAEYMEIGENYLSVMDIPVLKGRPFDPKKETDFQNAILINKKFADSHFANVDPIGQEVTFFDTLNCKVIGVVGDFMQDNFFDPLRPLALKYSKPERFQYVAVRSEVKDLAAVETVLAGIWKTQFPNRLFSHRYQDEYLHNALEINDNIKASMMLLAFITLALTITGLFALMSLSILKRMKEIAVRRVLGASISNISYILNKHYLLIILGGILVGGGVGSWLSSIFLDGIYSIHAGISSSVMIIAGGITLLAVGITIAIKIFHVMQMNPAEVLKGD